MTCDGNDSIFMAVEDKRAEGGEGGASQEGGKLGDGKP